MALWNKGTKLKLKNLKEFLTIAVVMLILVSWWQLWGQAGVEKLHFSTSSHVD